MGLLDTCNLISSQVTQGSPLLATKQSFSQRDSPQAAQKQFLCLRWSHRRRGPPYTRDLSIRVSKGRGRVNFHVTDTRPPGQNVPRWGELGLLDQGRRATTHSKGGSDWPSAHPVHQQSMSNRASDAGPIACPLSRALGRTHTPRDAATQAPWKGGPLWWQLGGVDGSDRWRGAKPHGQTGGSTLGPKTVGMTGKAGGLDILSPSCLPWETYQRKQEKCVSFEFSKASVLQKRELMALVKAD